MNVEQEVQEQIENLYETDECLYLDEEALEYFSIGQEEV